MTQHRVAMPQITISQSESDATDATSSRISDLLIVGDTVYGTQRFDGGIISWNIETLAQTSQTAYPADPLAGAAPSLAQIGETILSAGWVNQGLALHDLRTNGTLGPSNALANTPALFQLNSQTDGSDTSVFGISTNGQSITQLSFDDTNQLTNIATIPSELTITDITTATIGTTPYLFTVSATDNSVTSWEQGPRNDLSPVSYLGNTDGFWVQTPTAIATATVSGETYLIIAGSGSSSLSVLQIDQDGSLQTVTHILDDRSTRFANPSTLDVIQRGDATFILASGSDDGLSIFQLLPGGGLLHRTSIADTDEISLANPAAIAARATASGIEFIVASSTEPGLTRLNFDIGANDDLVIGTNGADTLSAGSGNDILLDQAGADVLTGGAGRDIFVMTADGDRNTITDFALGYDRVDLSAWTGLRSASQLTLQETASGLRITYGPEVLILQSSNDTSIEASDFIAQGLTITTQLPSTIVPGFSGPATTPPTLPDRILYVPPLQTPAPAEIGIERFGLAQPDRLVGGTFDDSLWGQGGDDTLLGNQGADTLFGGSGSDTLFGGDGGDQLSGGSGRNQEWAFSTETIETSDRLFGEDGNDDLLGYSGADWLDGGSGDDILTGGGGRDTFVFQKGSDRITDFAPYVDTLLLDTDLWSGELSARDVIDTFATRTSDQITFVFRDDRLVLEGTLDLSEIETRIEFIG